MNNLFIHEGIKVSNNGIYYDGKSILQSNELLEISPIRIMQANSLYEKLRDFLFVVPHLYDDVNERCNENSGIELQDITIPILPFGCAALYKRDNNQYNCFYKIDKKNQLIFIQAAKKINPGEELILKRL